MTLVVRGDGPAGAAAAAAAVRAGRDAALVGHGRVSPRGTLEVLDARATSALVALGWYDAVTTRAVPCHAVVSRWGQEEAVERSSLLTPGGLGWVVDRAWFDPLLRQLAAAGGTRLVRAPEASAAPVDVLATGKHAPGVRRVFGPDLLTLTVALPPAPASFPAGRLQLEAGAGWWWSALADAHSLAVSLTVPVASGTRDTTGLRATWCRAVADGPAWLPPGLAHVVPRARPVRSHLTLQGDGPRRAGDAALSVDPLSGHGLALALEGGLRCQDSDYDEWLAECAREHAQASSMVYAAAGFDPRVWAAA